MRVNDLYTSVTATIIKQLEEGVPPWSRSWKDGKLKGLGFIPTNLVTGRLYSGSNVLLLWLVAQERGYGNLQFCTFQQADSIGAKVKKGEKSASVLFTKHLVEKGEDGQDKPRTIIKAYSVFNVDQLENVPDTYLFNQELPNSEAVMYGQAAELISRNRITVRNGGNKAAYYPRQDEVHMPFANQFVSEDAYWQTFLHEVTHWSGNEKRLNRTFGKRFGDNAYTQEELCAELGSAFLCARLGIPAGFRSASYIDSWLKVMRADNRAVFTAASYAGQAADYLWNKAFPEVQRQAAE